MGVADINCGHALNQMYMPVTTDVNIRPRLHRHLVMVLHRKICIYLDTMDMLSTGNGDGFAGDSRKAVIVDNGPGKFGAA